MATSTAPATDVAHDTFPINGTDYIEFWVGNAKQAAHFYRGAFGFRLTGYRGPETGTRDRASYLLEQNKLRFVLTSPLGPDGEIAAHVSKHGDGVRDIAFWVDDARQAFKLAVERGAAPARQPEVLKDEHWRGRHRRHQDVRRHDPLHRGAPRLPRRRSCRASRRSTSPYEPTGVGLQYVDHCVGNVELGKMNEWVGFYSRVLGFFNLLSFDDKDISTEYSALMSKVMSNGNGRIKFPINEPAAGKKKSQIDEYLEFYGGPGVQHIAIATNDIVSTVTALRDRGVEFLRVPEQLLRHAAGTRRHDRRRPRSRCGTSGSSWTAMTKATCCRSSRSRCRTGRRSSTRSSSGRARRASAKATSRRCSRRLSASRRGAGISESQSPEARVRGARSFASESALCTPI